MNLNDVLHNDIKNLPDEILNSLYTSAHKEISRRRRFKMESMKTLGQIQRQGLKNKKHSIRSRHRVAEFHDLLSEDWSRLYPDNGGEAVYYVYAHIEPNEAKLTLHDHVINGIPFYVGKGTGNRAYDLKRNEGHGAKLKNLLSMKKKPEDIVYIFQDGLTENKAFELESKLIYFFGTKFQQNTGVLVNLTLPKTPYD
jgi:hypothetical protein